MNPMSFSKQIKYRIAELGPRAVFGLKDLIEYGTYDSIRKTLSRFCTEGHVSRVVSGIYCACPQDFEYTPPALEVAQAIARNNDNWSIIWGTVHARQMLGLSYDIEQNSYTFRSTGPTTYYEYDHIGISFHRTNVDIIRSMHPKSALVTSALMDLETHKITPHEIQKISEILTEEEKRDLFEDRKYAPQRLRCVYEIICGEYGLIGR